MQRQIKIIKANARQTAENPSDDKPARIDFFKIRDKWQREARLAKELRRKTDCKIFFGLETANL